MKIRFKWWLVFAIFNFILPNVMSDDTRNAGHWNGRQEKSYQNEANSNISQMNSAQNINVGRTINIPSNEGQHPVENQTVPKFDELLRSKNETPSEQISHIKENTEATQEENVTLADVPSRHGDNSTLPKLNRTFYDNFKFLEENETFDHIKHGNKSKSKHLLQKPEKTNFNPPPRKHASKNGTVVYGESMPSKDILSHANPYVSGDYKQNTWKAVENPLFSRSSLHKMQGEVQEPAKGGRIILPHHEFQFMPPPSNEPSNSTSNSKQHGKSSDASSIWESWFGKFSLIGRKRK